MLHFSDSKSMAKALRKSLAARQHEISHSDALEIVANQFGFANWNMLSARIDADEQPLALPPGWTITGLGRPNLYRIGVDPALPGAVRIATTDRTTPVDANAFGSLMQTILADSYLGHTVRVRADLKGRGVERGALWMRVDPAAGKALRFDNMMTRGDKGPIRGDTDWIERSVVLDIPEEAATIHYGVMLTGDGELWARNFTVETVDPEEVRVTAPRHADRPTNLGFRPPENPA